MYSQPKQSALAYSNGLYMLYLIDSLDWKKTYLFIFEEKFRYFFAVFFMQQKVSLFGFFQKKYYKINCLFGLFVLIFFYFPLVLCKKKLSQKYFSKMSILPDEWLPFIVNRKWLNTL